MLVWSDDNQATAEEAAVEFLRQHPEIWTAWVTPEAATRITASLN
jgi:glycine betaine/proline transport system substrate-binding protein